MAILGAKAAAQSLIAHFQQPEKPLQLLYEQALTQSALWQQLQRYRHVPELLQRESVYRQWPTFAQGVLQDLTRAEPEANPALWRILLRHSGRFILHAWGGYFEESAMSVNESLARNCYHPAESSHITLRGSLSEQQAALLEKYAPPDCFSVMPVPE